MQGDDPPFLPVGTDVSAKYKGAFCEAKIKKVVRNIKCKVSFKSGGGITIVSEDIIKGPLRVGSTVEIKQDPKKELIEAVITKIQDCSQYTVVFDDGDITTLRRSALCLKSGRHFNESETLDQLPLTHPEHFSTPVIASRRGRRGRAQSEESDGSASGRPAKAESVEREPHVGRVVLVETSTAADRRRPQPPAFPALVVAPTAQIKVKEDYLVRSFTNSRYYTVPKKETREFRKGSAPTDWPGVDAALQYLSNGTLPPHWDRDAIFNDARNTSDDSSDDEPREEKDHFVAQLYKFMDDRGTPLNRNPTIANRDIDLYRLFRVVQKLGGYNRVTNQNQWKTIADKMGFHPVTTTITNLCKQAYKKFLHSFEDFYRKLGVTLVAHPRGARTPPSGRSLIRDRDKQLPTATSSTSAPNNTPQPRTKDRDKDSDKSEADKSEKEDKSEKIEKIEKQPEKIKDKPRASDGEDSGDNQPLATAPKNEKEKPPEEKTATAMKSQKNRFIPVKTESQEKRIPKPRRPMISKSESSGHNISMSRASRRPHASTDSDSSGRASRCGITRKMQSRRSQSANSASSGNTIASNGSKRPRKRKSTEQSHSEPTRSAGSTVKAMVGDKLKVYYGPTQSESKVTYEAKVIEISAEGMLRVHYTGWNTRYDEWIKPQRIALNVTQHERTHSKKNSNSRRARAKRTEESSPRSVSSDSDSEADNKRPPKKSEEKNNPMPRSKTPGRIKEDKTNENEATKPRKRPIRTVSTPSVVSPVKRPRSSIATHQGRDYDLNEIRSELKGLHSVKQEQEEIVKTDMPEKEPPPTELPEQPPEQKELEDVYEFKEPEPFEIELHDEKKKRTHRIFDDISPSKYTSSLSKSLSEEISEDALRTRPLLRSPSLSPFRDYSARDATERNSPEETSKDGLFSLDDDSFHGDGSSGPIFEGFTPAKNQETYSKKNKVSKLRELIDDSPDSPADDEQSSDDERMDIVLKEERESPELSPIEDVPSEEKYPNKSPDHNKEEFVDCSSNTDEIAVIKEKTPEPVIVPTPIPIPEIKEESKEEASQSVTVTPDVTSPILDAVKPANEETKAEDEVVEVPPKSPKLEPISTLLIDTEEDKSEPDSPARLDVLPEPPPSFLLHPPIPKISERLLEAINSAKRSSASPPPSDETSSSPKDKSPKAEQDKIALVSIDSIKLSVNKMEPVKNQPKPESTKKSDPPEANETLFGESSPLQELKREADTKKLKTNPVKEQSSPRLSPLNVLERRKSVPDMPLNVPGKNNKVLSDTILKLSSQINQSAAAALPLPTFTPEEHSESCDSDDSDRRLIIDKLSMDEWASGGSSEASRGVGAGPAESMVGVLSARAAAAHAGKSPGEWSAGETLLMLEDACKNERKHSANVVVAGNARPAPAPAAVEEDSNISLLLCEETIPGSPAPDVEPAPARHRLHMPFASAPPHHHDPHHNKDDRRSVEVGSVSGIIGVGGANGGTKAGESAREMGRARGRPRDAEAEGGAWGRGAMLDNTPPTTPDTSPDRTPPRERESPPSRKDLDDDSHHEPCAMDLEKPHGGMLGGRRSRKVSESSSVGGIGGAAGRGRARRRRDTDDQPPLLSSAVAAPAPTPAPPLKYNFYVELDPSWDSQTRINLLTSRLNELRKAYHAVKAELAAVDRRRKKLRRKEREAVKAAKAACL